MQVALDFVVIKVATPGHHGAVEGEGSLVEPQALESDGDPAAKVHSKAGREKSTGDRGGDAEGDKDDKDEVVVAFQSRVRGGVEEEQ